MHRFNPPLGTWALAAYIVTTNLKGHFDDEAAPRFGRVRQDGVVTAHRIRETWNDASLFGDTATVDEVYVVGNERNKREWKKMNAGRVVVGKQPVLVMKARESGKVKAEVVETTDKGTLQGCVRSNTARDAMVYTDEASTYVGINLKHEAVKQSVKEFVRGQVHANVMKLSWATLKCGYNGTFRHFYAKQLHRCFNAFAERHSDRPLDTGKPDRCDHLRHGRQAAPLSGPFRTRAHSATADAMTQQSMTARGYQCC